MLRESVIAAATEALGEFPAAFDGYWLAGMRAKLGLRTAEAGDAELIQALLDWMAKTRADFTNTFRDLSAEGPPAGDRYGDPDFQTWYVRRQERLDRGDQPKAAAVAQMRAANPPSSRGTTASRRRRRRPRSAATSPRCTTC